MIILHSFGSSGPTAWNDMPAHLRNLDLPLSDFRQLLKRFVPDCSGVVTVRAFVTVNLLIEHFEMSVYYYYDIARWFTGLNLEQIH